MPPGFLTGFMVHLSKKQWFSFYAVAIGCLFLVSQVFADVHREFRVSFLDVGQGDSILIQTPEFKTILIDTGPDSTVVDRLGEQMGFFDKSIDLFILTHPDRDHHAGILDVMRQYQIKQILLTGVSNRDPMYLEFLAEAKRQNIPIVFPQSDEDWQIGSDLYLDLLYPYAGQDLVGQSVKNRNNTSVVLRLLRQTDDGMEALMMLSGDAEVEQERELVVSGQDLTADILKLGHHGSKTSTTDGFLAAVDPKTVVISVGKDNQFGHPHPETMEKVADLEVRQTMGEGTIEFMW